MEPDRAVDENVLASLREVLRQHPVRLGVLIGSHASGTAGSHSDVDVAVEFEPAITGDDRYRERISLVVALTRALGTDDLDLIDLDGVRPAVGRSALEDAFVLVGDPHRVDQLSQRFARAADTPTPEQRRERFDAVLERLEESV